MVEGLRALSNHGIPCRAGASLAGMLEPKMVVLSVYWPPAASCPQCPQDKMAASAVSRAQTLSETVPKQGQFTDIPPSCPGSGCRQEPEGIMDPRLRLCLCIWPQLPDVCSAPTNTFYRILRLFKTNATICGARIQIMCYVYTIPIQAFKYVR